jgi:hypothetical protein
LALGSSPSGPTSFPEPGTVASLSKREIRANFTNKGAVVLQFDLEQQIMDCWGIVDDIKCLRKVQDIRSFSDDERDNYMLGLESIYQAKFEVLFDTFEKFVKEYYQHKKSKPVVM